MPEGVDTRTTIALTMGDPAGIGPEVVLKALADNTIAPLARWIVIGDGRVLSRLGRLQCAELRDLPALGDAPVRFGRNELGNQHLHRTIDRLLDG